jgi:chromosome segregation protein
MDRLRERILQEFRVDLTEEARRAEEEKAERQRTEEQAAVEQAAVGKAPGEEAAGEEQEDEEQQRLQIADLRQKLLKLGPVNFLAADEYADQKERLLFHRKQQEDLRKARQDLLDAIQQINETAGRMFKETFDLARLRFQETFESLFPGGEADLIFHGEDPLEGSIEIKARPRGKRLEAIRLLSTGERSLTAISLLFGIYLVKPSPFCILDELDAPLDDANIDRFVTLLRTFSERTQFVVITHNKRTMEASDRLFGVTMQTAGISKIVSVRLSDADWELSPAAAEVLQTSSEEGGET